MRYLIVSPYPPDRCGIAAYTLQLAASLRREGHTTEVVSGRPSAADHHADLYSVRGCLTVARLSQRFDKTLIEFFPELLFPSLRRDLFLRQWPVVAMLMARCRNVELVVHEAPYAALRHSQGLR
ncbi:MAG: hypothetical protein J2P57_23105, partial [Acidimicrobiaceae bacterium]|nr:hypothetical protein [Acidimicrobiaceae bacterium]